MNIEDADKIPKSYDDLYAENKRLRAMAPVGQKATTFLIVIVALCIIAAGFVLAITVIRPEKDNSSIILSITGIVVPVVTALLAATVQQVHLAVNSRLSQLLELTAQASKAEGRLAEGRLAEGRLGTTRPPPIP